MSTPITHASFTLERKLDAPVSRVWSAFSDYGNKKKWFVGPEEWTQGESSLDFREGGSETDTGGPEGGFVSSMKSVYHDIVENQRIVYSYEMYLNGERMSVSLSTIEMESDGDGTRLTLTEQGAYFTSEDHVEGRKEGAEGLLDALKAFVEGN
ncbi:SRPBCC family protein [Arthrobacter sp. NA-172]|uniref:SRPBCC family protein n=1 Tax=Arthrobacter sp. NA-172 TaxID=3367524 RepID=UPI003754D463